MFSFKNTFHHSLYIPSYVQSAYREDVTYGDVQTVSNSIFSFVSHSDIVRGGVKAA